MYALWSSCFAIGKYALSACPPFFFTGFRMALGGAIILGFILLFRRASLKMTRKQFFPLLLLGFFSVYLTNILEYWGLQYLTAAKTCFIYSLSPFIAALLSYIHFGEKMTRAKWIGMGVGFCGIAPILLMQSGAEQGLSAFAFLSWPELALMGAAIASVYGWVILRMVVKEQTFSPLTANGVSMLFGALLAFIHSFFTESWSASFGPVTDMAPFLKGALLTTIISNIICYNIYGMMLKRYTATFLSFMGLLSPVFASFHGWVLLGETPSWQIFFATAIVSSGLWMVYRAELRQGYILTANKPAETA